MSYITTLARDALLMRGMEGAGPVIRNADELGYLLSSLVGQYLTELPISYERLNTVIGALECAKLEAYRRLAVPHESARITQETDVYLPVIRQMIEEHRDRDAERAIQEKAKMAEELQTPEAGE